MYQDSDRTIARFGPSIAYEASKLAIDDTQTGDVNVLKLTGDILLDDGDLVFRARVHDLMVEGRNKLVVDFEHVDHVDSSGVGMLVAKLQTIRKNGGDIRLVHLVPRLQRLLTTMRVLKLFKVFDDEAAAVRSFA